MKDTLSLGSAAATWAGGFYLRHFVLVFGLSLIPTLQRFAVVRWDLPPAVSITTEVLVALVRILLVALAVRLMVLECGFPAPEAWARLKFGLDARRIAFWGQWALLAVAFATFDLVPNVLIATVVPESGRELVTAWLVAVKNPTIIAFTVLWMVGIARTLIIDPDPALDDQTTSTGGSMR
ncbi:hypothetical protein Ait01nite_085150 [Actinoplanes italicus]|uniref:Uncharacterized protein n=1 Tax=Actinoplanes italicus TaxID=113567 RepID=A0A2T0JXG0_9ACTN|nr:hypothetical protein [Actinoplanes italicus]PRX12350.1 hypothetical protein CLV67_1284 [Actinoplanes italicus]GIE35470.1 hypothetical protein Ait01nite_085150 [Actinoplanes italicus]